jgi:large subunit ribosomal protein L17
LFHKIAPAFSGRTSGYTRLISLPTRKGDNAKMMKMEWTEKITNNEELKSKSEKAPKKVKPEKKVVKKVTKDENVSTKRKRN